MTTYYEECPTCPLRKRAIDPTRDVCKSCEGSYVIRNGRPFYVLNRPRLVTDESAPARPGDYWVMCPGCGATTVHSPAAVRVDAPIACGHRTLAAMHLRGGQPAEFWIRGTSRLASLLWRLHWKRWRDFRWRRAFGWEDAPRRWVTPERITGRFGYRERIV